MTESDHIGKIQDLLLRSAAGSAAAREELLALIDGVLSGTIRAGIRRCLTDMGLLPPEGWARDERVGPDPFCPTVVISYYNDAIRRFRERIVHEAPQFGSLGALVAYLVTIVRNRALNKIRRQRREGSPADERPPEPPGHEPDPAAAAAKKDLVRMFIDRAVEVTPEGDRPLFLDLMRRTPAEIAEEQGCTEGAIRARRHRIFCRIREKMQNWLNTQGGHHGE